MTFPPLTLASLARTTGQLQTAALAVLPHGGQRSARRNAWAAMSSDAAQARARYDAERALDHAVARAGHRSVAAR